MTAMPETNLDPIQQAIVMFIESAIETLLASARVPSASDGSGWQKAVRMIQDCSPLTQLVAALEADERLGRLKANPPESHGVFWKNPQGGGWRDSSTGIALGLIWRALQSVLLQGKDIVPANLIESAFDNLRILRLVNSGKSVDLTYAVEMRNVNLSAGESIQTDLGEIRRLPPLALLPLPYSDRSATFLFSVQTRMKSTVEQNPDGDWTDVAFMRQLRMKRVLLQLAFAFSDLAMPIFGPSTILYPFAGSVSGGLALEPDEWGREQGVGLVGLDAASKASLQENAHEIQHGYTQSMDVAYSRIVRARFNRNNPVDSLVDAVIAWESMFGSNGETVFRVTGALATVIEPNPKERADLVRRLKDIYSLRSGVVHGRKEPNGGLQQAAEEALDVAARAIRVMHQMRSDFRDLPSEQRSAELLLGGIQTHDRG